MSIAVSPGAKSVPAKSVDCYNTKSWSEFSVKWLNRSDKLEAKGMADHVLGVESPIFPIRGGVQLK